MSTTELILAFIASNVFSLVAGIAWHGWLARQKSPTLALDEIKAASAVLNSARASAANAVVAAAQRKEAVDLALTHAGLTTPAA